MNRAGRGFAIAYLVSGTLSMCSTGWADVITTFNNRSTFDTAVGATTVEDFTSTAHFPITTGVLNSFTNLVVQTGSPITPGTIQPGVTYSTVVSGNTNRNDFNIDAGGGFTGGFLDSIRDPGNPSIGALLTVAFTGPVAALGFDTNSLMGNTFAITIDFTSGAPFVSAAVPVGGSGFFGFESNLQDIKSVEIAGTSGTYGFALDNFTFTQTGTFSATPEPASISLFCLVLAGVIFAAYRRRGTVSWWD
jgi:hypothetical protein